MATILIVDDFSANRTVLATLLRREGHRLVEAADGREGLAAVHAEHPDLVITDLMMPRMDGYEFVKQLRLDPATQAIPVLFHTAPYGEREARAMARADGVSDVLPNPAEPAEVLEVVGRVLAGRTGTPVTSDAARPAADGDREQLRLLTDQLSEAADDLRIANVRLRALINIGLDFASERDDDRRLHRVCASTRDLFGATSVTLTILDRPNRTVQRVVTCGADTADKVVPGDPIAGIATLVVAERRAVRGDRAGAASGLDVPWLPSDVQAFLAAPIASSAHVYGWIDLVRTEGLAFTDEDEQLVVALAAQVGRIYELEHEIVERKQAEAALRQERDRAKRCLDTAEVILLALDLEGRITMINRWGCHLLGRPEEELIGRDWIATCLPERIRPALTSKFQSLLAGNVAAVENPILMRSGEERLIEWCNTLLRDDKGQVIGTFSSGTDISERNRVVEALRTAEERMRFALEAARVGIWDMDFTTGILRWSPILEAQYGLPPNTFGRTFDAFVACVHPDDRAQLLETLERVTRSGADFSLPHRTRWPDGTVRWLSGAGRIHLGANGEPVRAVGITQDVTERRALEAQYQEAQKMEAVGRLAGGVAHDFNNLLTAILGYCELLLADLAPGDPRLADIGEIQKAGRSAARLIRQLLAFSRREIIEPTLLDLNGMVSGLREMLGRLIGDDVRLVLGLEPGLGLLRADRGQIEQIIMNLVVNAQDAMPRGGTLTIETAQVELDEHYAATHMAAMPGPYIMLAVSDTGTGMTPEVQARLFEPFFTTKERGKGTGLGLATVHGIATQGGGSVNVYSEVGKGTSFKVYFRRAVDADVIVEPRPAMTRPPRGTQTVLVVDDAEGLRQLTRRLLQKLGYTVLVAANAEEALALVEQHPNIDVLLTDVVMPGASGPELTLQLVAKRPSLKVVYMSGYTEEAIVHHGVINPGTLFLHKPFTSDTLGRKIGEALGRRSAESDRIAGHLTSVTGS
jgi:two-component system cell cycle sensor histidine kinase/response regulator CckA